MLLPGPNGRFSLYQIKIKMIQLIAKDITNGSMVAIMEPRPDFLSYFLSLIHIYTMALPPVPIIKPMAATPMAMGKTPFAAVNLIMPIAMGVAAIGFMIGTGGSAIVSKTLGEGKPDKANEYFSLLIYTAIGISVTLSILGFIFRCV